MPHTLTGESLRLALALTPLPVRWVRWQDPGPAVDITPSMALAIVKGGVYEGKAVRLRDESGKPWVRVKLIRELPSPKRNPYLECWLNQDAAVLRFG